MALYDTVGWAATRDVVVDGTQYQAGDSVPAPALAAERKRDVLMSTRLVVPMQDPHMRRTDWYGFNTNGATGPLQDNPRRIPTPTHLDARSFAAVGGLSAFQFDESFDLPFAGENNG